MSPNSARPLPPPEEGKVHGRELPYSQSAGEGWPHPHRLKATFTLRRKETDLVVVLKSGGQKDYG